MAPGRVPWGRGAGLGMCPRRRGAPPAPHTTHQTALPPNGDAVASSSISSVLESSMSLPPAKGGEVTGGASGSSALGSGPWQKVRVGEAARYPAQAAVLGVRARASLSVGRFALDGFSETRQQAAGTSSWEDAPGLVRWLLLHSPWVGVPRAPQAWRSPHGPGRLGAQDSPVTSSAPAPPWGQRPAWWGWIYTPRGGRPAPGHTQPQDGAPGTRAPEGSCHRPPHPGQELR